MKVLLILIVVKVVFAFRAFIMHESETTKFTAFTCAETLSSVSTPIASCDDSFDIAVVSFKGCFVN